MTGQMGDALSSAGLLLAALALVFSAWAPTIDKSLATTLGPGEAAKERQKDAIRSVLRQRAAPLAVVSGLIAIAFMPRVLKVICTTAQCASGRLGRCGYDDVAALFMLTEVLILLLAVHLSRQARDLWKKAR